MEVRAIRAYVTIESDDVFTYFTGSLVKTVVYSLAREVRLFHGVRGILSPIHVSPLFKPGRGDYELGDLYTSVIVKTRDGEKLIPVNFTGEEFIIHIGGEAGLVGHIGEQLERLRTPLSIKFRDTIVVVKLVAKKDVTDEIFSKMLGRDKVTVYFKGPVKPFNVLSPSRLPKFSPNAYEVLMAGYMFYKNIYTLDYRYVMDSMKLLGLLVETYYTLNTVKPILVPFKGKEPAMIGKATYIIDTENPDKKEQIEKILNTSEITGVGESRQNGFGTVSWTRK